MEEAPASEVPYLPVYLSGEGERFAIVDRDLFLVVSQHRWHVHRSRRGVYARAWTSSTERTFLHLLVQKLRRRRKPSPDHVVRHLSGNTMDNRSSNLRWGTRASNVWGAACVVDPWYGGDHHARNDMGDPGGEELPDI